MGGIVGKVFGGSSDKQVTRSARETKPTSFSGGGLVGNFAGNRFTVSPTGTRARAVNNVSNAFTNRASRIGELTGLVSPGFGRLSQSTRDIFDTRRTSALSNLRDNLSRRRVAGSSFAQDSLARAEAEFAQQEEQALAQNFLQELELSNNLIQQETQATISSFLTRLNDLNLQTEIATGLSTNATNALAGLAQAETNALVETRSQNSEISGGLLGLGLSFL